MAERAIKMLGGGAVVTAALLGEYAVEDPSGEVVAVDCTVRRKADEFFEKADSRRKLEQMWFEFMNGEGQPRKTRGKGLDVGGEAVPVLTAAQTAHAEWSRLFMLKGRFAKMVRLAASLTCSDASDAIELLRPLMDALRARVKEG
jgi:acetylornithine/succinyldiaminopimelate/putrescine aminotransferase